MADLRPMEFGEILDGSLQLFRRHFGLFLKLSLAVMWLPLAASLYFRARFLGFGSMNPQATAALMQNEIVPLVLLGLLWGVLYGAGMLMLTAGSIRAISDSYLGREPEFGESMRFGIGKIVPLFLVGLGKGLLLILLYILCAGVILLTGAAGGMALLLVFIEVIAAVWLVVYVACGYMVTTPVVVLETLNSNLDAFGRSWALTKGMRGRLFGLVFVAYLIASWVPALVLAVVGSIVGELAPAAVFAWTVIGAVLPVVLTPIIPCVLTLAYYDLRVRHEGFDLQLLSEQLGSV